MSYTAPAGDIMIVLEDIAGLSELAGRGLLGDLDADTVAAILDEAGRFAAERIAPLNQPGDREGARIEDGVVVMPEGWAQVYREWREAGWSGLPGPREFGGQGLPVMLAMAVSELWQSASMAFALNPMLTQGAADLLGHFGGEEIRQRYVPKLVSGEWTGTMMLTEPQAGSDLGAMKTRAEPQDDGTYRLYGTKIFITYGEHDMADNIVHLALARTPGAPPGTKGISLFMVPKYLAEPDGSPGARNDVHCVSIEHKLGIHASPTCVMQMGDHGGATAWLVGGENRGLAAMFHMMNRARLAVGVQGVGIAERAYQQALAHARERRQGRTADGEALSIVEHPDVRRMLLSMKSKTAAARAVCLMTARLLDLAERAGDEDEREGAHAAASLLTPVAKAFATDMGVEVASEGVQVHGGMGYVEETGAAQHLRDARIAPIYEGTNGIQAIDLVTRKLPLEEGAVVRRHIAELQKTVNDVRASNLPAFGQTPQRLEEAVDALSEATEWMLGALGSNRQAALAGAAPYTRLFGIASGAVWLAKGAVGAARRDDDAGSVLALARYYAENHAVEAPGLARTVTEGGESVLEAASPVLGG